MQNNQTPTIILCQADGTETIICTPVKIPE
jgi:hypothetical protein